MTVEEFLADWRADGDLIAVHTSGSTGTPKRLLVEKRRMEASARITCRFLGLSRGDTALLCLPMDYIAGKMMVVRAITQGLRLVSVSPSSHPMATVSQPIDFAAMVPLQVSCSLETALERERLMAVRQLIIGGGAVDPTLEAELRSWPNAVWSTYGMTETLSHIALRRLSGSEASLWYRPFEGVTLNLANDGCLVVDAPAVSASRLKTNDMAELRPDGCFRILGRKDNVICSGGLKIQAEEVERLLLPHLGAPFLVTRRPDERLGQAVTLLTEGSTDEARQVCNDVLPRHWRPRHFITVDHLPTTPNGKPARAEAERIAKATNS